MTKQHRQHRSSENPQLWKKRNVGDPERGDRNRDVVQKILGSMSGCAWKEGWKDLPIQDHKNREKCTRVYSAVIELSCNSNI